MGVTTPSSEVVIRLRDLHKSFGPRAILRGVDLDVRRGETLIVMGGSGIGKSTVLWHVAGVHQPDSGTLEVFGRNIVGMKESDLRPIRKRIGICFQFGALYNSMTVGDNIALPLREHTDLAPDIVDIIVKMKLELVGLRGCQDLKPAQLSGGMRKRAGLARALAMDPELLLYDEPTSGLDPVTSAVISRLIADLNRKLGVTSIVVTHDMTSAFTVGDRLAMLYDGRIVEIGTRDEIRATTNPIVRQFIEGRSEGPFDRKDSRDDYVADLMGQVPRGPTERYR